MNAPLQSTLQQNQLPRYIAIEGPIRVGKSSLVNILADRLHARKILDSEANPFLERFYNNKPGAAFQAQMYYLIHRYHQLKEIDTAAPYAPMLICDYLFEKDKIFAYINLNDEELRIYDQYFTLLAESLPKPDLVIYLQATPEVLLKRIEKKKVKYEVDISLEYLTEVSKAFDHFFFHYTASDLLVINTSEIDFIERSDDLNELLHRLQQPVKGTQYYLPLGSK